MTQCNPYDNQYLVAAAERRRKNCARQRRRRERLKAQGICVQCGRNSALRGETLCSDCKLLRNQMRSGVQYAKESRKRPPVPDERRLARDIAARTGLRSADTLRVVSVAADVIADYLEQFGGMTWTRHGRFVLLVDDDDKGSVLFLPGKRMIARFAMCKKEKYARGGKTRC